MMPGVTDSTPLLISLANAANTYTIHIAWKIRRQGAYMVEFTIDPEFRDLLPALSDDEFTRLRDDINKNGCRDKLVVWREWKILIDGHNRHDICTTLDLPFETTEMSFTCRDEVKLWMIRNQLARRNITDAKRVVLNLMLKPVLAAKAKENMLGGDRGNQHTGGKVATLQNSAKLPEPEKLDTRAEIAKASGVSHDTVHRVESVMQKADEPTKAKMLSGEMSINEAYKTVQAPKPAPERAAIEELTEKQKQGWHSVSQELFSQIRDYCRKIPASKIMVVADLRKLAKSIEGKKS